MTNYCSYAEDGDVLEFDLIKHLRNKKCHLQNRDVITTVNALLRNIIETEKATGAPNRDGGR